MDELEAMKIAHDALAELDEDSRARVIHWLAAKYCSSPAEPPPQSQSGLRGGPETVPHPSGTSRHNTFAEFLAVTGAESDADRALVAAYWLQEVLSEEAVDTQSANTLLKDTGYPIGNVTRAFDRLKSMKPCPVVQTRKTGSTKQARKLYKVSAHGISTVKKMEKGDV
ncbi:hypothetical protein [Hyphomonas sp.]|uniref:hypothetical protein n=1 Tax=Hyphomonas sp. TaxID=87 RepID=UPI0025BC95B2|nr:hypothetical protein [Hyphomonas sp.]